jgi:anaerobic magnesium-protoporphyrin IX monomethyl ester cyclase
MKRRRPILIVDQTSYRDGPASLGPPYVAQAARDAGYPVHLLNLSGDLAERRRTLLDAVGAHKPLFVGFSTVTSGLLAHDIALSKMLHGMGIKVVWGGIFATTVPEAPARAEYIDYVVVGEGERPIVGLAEAIQAGVPPAGVPGVVYRDHGEVILQPPLPPEMELDRYRFGADLIDWTPYIMRGYDASSGKLVLPFSRGCPFRCAFCYNCTIGGNDHWRAHSAEYLNDLLGFFRDRYEVTAFYFSGDNIFGRVREAKRIIEQLDGVRWNGGVHAGCVDRDFLDWAQANRCFGLAFGFESGSDRVLHAMKKGITAESIRDCLRVCAERDVEILASFMGFVPGETPADLQETVAMMEFVHGLRRGYLMKFHVFRAYAGTEYWNQSLDLGLVPPASVEEWASYRPEIWDLLGYDEGDVMKFARTLEQLYRRDNPSYAHLVLQRRMLKAELQQLVAKFAARAA